MLFEHYAPAIGRLAGAGPLVRAEVLVPEFRLARQGSVSVYFAPLEYVNVSASLAIIGITPGWTQMEIAYRVARDELRAGTRLEDIGKRAKQSAAFAGSMRTNLFQMLGLLGVPERLGLASPGELFGRGWDLIHTTSVLRYPVFIGDSERNYTGHNPRLGASAWLRTWIEQWFVPEIRRVSEALLIPLGDAVSDVLEELTRMGCMERERCLLGFPHPSGANGHRQAHFAQRLEALRRTVADHFASRGSAV